MQKLEAAIRIHNWCDFSVSFLRFLFCFVFCQRMTRRGEKIRKRSGCLVSTLNSGACGSRNSHWRVTHTVTPSRLTLAFSSLVSRLLSCRSRLLRRVLVMLIRAPARSTQTHRLELPSIPNCFCSIVENRA